MYFLGGYDLEMIKIKHILRDAGLEFFDKNLTWGAKASTYSEEIAGVLERGGTPVLIELEIDVELPSTVIVVDHHGNRSGEEASILQVIRLLRYHTESE